MQNYPTIPLIDHLNQRFSDIEDKAEIKSIDIANRIIEQKARELIDRDTFKEFSSRTNHAFEKTIDDLANLKTEILGKEAFNTYIQHTSEDVQRIRDDIRTTASLATTVREGAAKALSESVIEQNKVINSRFEDIIKMIVASQQPPWQLWLMGLAVLFSILAACYFVIIDPLKEQDKLNRKDIQTIKDELETRGQHFENIDKSLQSLTEQLLKNRELIMNQLQQPKGMK